MRKIIACLLAVFGLTSAYGQKGYEDVGVKEFAELVADSSVVVLDVRTAEEFAEGHIERAINIDIKGEDFLVKAQSALPKDRMIAVYCRSGRRSADACDKLSAEGFRVVNLKGGILAWIDEKMPVSKE
ncbi:MAG: rhodanese-like domain-containing protein [Prevotella sp.]|nr:rhodanese-like domain-containing protein [Prevotella sp.]